MSHHEAVATSVRASSPFTAPESTRKRSRPGQNSDADCYGGSINPLFLVSGPRGGAISIRTAMADLETFADVVDDGVLHVLREAWEAVAVPADTYWSSPQQANVGTDATSALLRRGATTTASAAPSPPRIPNPRQLLSSFYPARVEALAGRGYQAHRGLVPVALDRKGGKGSKTYNVLPRWDEAGQGGTHLPAASTDALADSVELNSTPPSRRCRTSALANFVEAIPQPTSRNLYVLVDEECPVDPYFDVDFSYDTGVDGTNRLSTLQLVNDAHDVVPFTAEGLETTLFTILTALRDEVEQQWGTKVEECLVLTSSTQLCRHTSRSATPALMVLKISFHVHFRLADRAVVDSVRELHAFMTALRAKLQHTQAAGASSDSSAADKAAAQRAALLLDCVDFGVYTRWRAFRLPYNVKAPEGDGVKKSSAAAATDIGGDDIVEEQLARLGVSLPDIRVGCAAPSIFQNIAYSADAETQKAQRYLVEKLVLRFRFLLPLLPGATSLVSKDLEAFLFSTLPKHVQAALHASSSSAAAMATATAPPGKDAVAAWVMDMASIIRDATDLALPRSSLQADPVDAHAGADVAEAFKLLRFAAAPSAAAETTTTAFGQSAASPFDLPMPPMPRSVRTRVGDRALKALLAEVFWCLAPEYDHPHASVGRALEGASHVPNTAITPERINAHYEESIRAYYVYQKQNKFCFSLQRTHKATYVQLYLTFGSVKVRCYSNDCCGKCCVVPWEAPEDPAALPHHHSGYPKFDRLAEIRKLLFPALPASELVRRYGTSVLQLSS